MIGDVHKREMEVSQVMGEPSRNGFSYLSALIWMILGYNFWKTPSKMLMRFKYVLMIFGGDITGLPSIVGVLYYWRQKIDTSVHLSSRQNPPSESKWERIESNFCSLVGFDISAIEQNFLYVRQTPCSMERSELQGDIQKAKEERKRRLAQGFKQGPSGASQKQNFEVSGLAGEKAI